MSQPLQLIPLFVAWINMFQVLLSVFPYNYEQYRVAQYHISFLKLCLRYFDIGSEDHITFCSGENLKQISGFSRAIHMVIETHYVYCLTGNS